MIYRASVFDRVVTAVIVVRAAIAFTFIAMVVAAYAGLLDNSAFNAELVRFFWLLPRPMIGLWAFYAGGYLIAAALLWTGRPSRALIAYGISFALNIAMWTLLATNQIYAPGMPIWSIIADVVTTLTDLAVVSYLAFVVLSLRKPDSMRWT